ncbi:MAG: 50S ribosomal protein L18 [Candidatus Bipolaricaulia bacterium]
MIRRQSRTELRRVRHRRIRKKISGTAERPRLCVYKSLKHLYAQLIDDIQGRTLVAASTHDRELRQGQEQEIGYGLEAAEQVGKLLAQRARKAGIETVVFDRSGYPYHGKVKALAEASRKEGLRF